MALLENVENIARFEIGFNCIFRKYIQLNFAYLDPTSQIASHLFQEILVNICIVLIQLCWKLLEHVLTFTPRNLRRYICHHEQIRYRLRIVRKLKHLLNETKRSTYTCIRILGIVKENSNVGWNRRKIRFQSSCVKFLYDRDITISFKFIRSNHSRYIPLVAFELPPF